LWVRVPRDPLVEVIPLKVRVPVILTIPTGQGGVKAQATLRMSARANWQ